MASLGWLGAAEGLGRGMVINAEREENRRDVIKKSALDEARDARLENIRQTGRVTIQNLSDTAADKRNADDNIAANLRNKDTIAGQNTRQSSVNVTTLEEAKLDNTAAAERNRLDNTNLDTRSRLDRESREKIAGMGDNTWDVQFTTDEDDNDVATIYNKKGDVLRSQGAEMWQLNAGPEQTAFKDKATANPQILKDANRAIDAMLKGIKDRNEKKEAAQIIMDRYGYLPRKYLELLDMDGYKNKR